jgi:hypothetical protein
MQMKKTLLGLLLLTNSFLATGQEKLSQYSPLENFEYNPRVWTYEEVDSMKLDLRGKAVELQEKDFLSLNDAKTEKVKVLDEENIDVGDALKIIRRTLVEAGKETRTYETTRSWFESIPYSILKRFDANYIEKLRDAKYNIDHQKELIQECEEDEYLVKSGRDLEINGRERRNLKEIRKDRTKYEKRLDRLLEKKEDLEKKVQEEYEEQMAKLAESRRKEKEEELRREQEKKEFGDEDVTKLKPGFSRPRVGIDTKLEDSGKVKTKPYLITILRNPEHIKGETKISKDEVGIDVDTSITFFGMTPTAELIQEIEGDVEFEFGLKKKLRKGYLILSFEAGSDRKSIMIKYEGWRW